MIDKFAIVREDLHRRYGHLFDAATIDAEVDGAIDKHRDARIADFVPVLVERDASESLQLRADEQGKASDTRKEILFVCEHNAGRSQLAAALTRHLAGEKVVYRSVGLNPEGGINPTVIEVLRERNIDHEHLYQKGIVPRVVHASDVVVLMGVDEVPGVPGQRLVRWDIADPAQQPLETVREIADQVEQKVRELLTELEIL
ncbi:arsenate-mycothiol transferase ArsC [Corynebacterium kozikiae]|uniref:arsenate-mycothiol transferase ArsC n=1 Tax=Corynebacterium kozikiae TaxID=2968469 RepID=UPI00211D006A|nr:protein tyrosine phosphatase [Corynebacterium sp. 76QC2CO]MCQ9342638.1 protein tyrosine phosphatase [Corynebacterium sp. 76QC2CO]